MRNDKRDPGKRRDPIVCYKKWYEGKLYNHHAVGEPSRLWYNLSFEMYKPTKWSVSRYKMLRAVRRN